MLEWDVALHAHRSGRGARGLFFLGKGLSGLLGRDRTLHRGHGRAGMKSRGRGASAGPGLESRVWPAAVEWWGCGVAAGAGLGGRPERPVPCPGPESRLPAPPTEGPSGGRVAAAAGRWRAAGGPARTVGRISRKDAGRQDRRGPSAGLSPYQEGGGGVEDRGFGPTHLQTPGPRPASSGSHQAPRPSVPPESGGLARWLPAACGGPAPPWPGPPPHGVSWPQGPWGGGRGCASEGGREAGAFSASAQDRPYLRPQL